MTEICECGKSRNEHYYHEDSGNYYCGARSSKKFKAEDKSGENSPSWKGGIRKTRDGYMEIYSPHHPNKNKNNCVLEHRLIMEKYLGRFLTKKEVVHHNDHNKKNNDIDNLTLFSSVGKHTQAHHIIRDTKGRFKKHGK